MTQDGSQGAEWTHELVVRRLAGEMFRSAMWVALATVLVCVVVWTVVGGVPGLVASLLGGVIACVSSAGTLLLMSKTAALPVQFIMVAALGGFMAKIILLFIAVLVLRKFPELHPNALALTMAATVVATTFMEVRASKRSRSQIVVPTPGNT